MKNKALRYFLYVVSSLVISACVNNGDVPTVAEAEPVGTSCTHTSVHRGSCKLEGLPTNEPDDVEDLWHHITQGYQLTKHSSHPKVVEKFEYYRSRPQFIQTIGERSSRYLHFIVEAIRERNMPMEFALLPAIESSFDPFAYSHGRAAGLWQFVPLTAKHMGMDRSWWYDGRRDVIASTEAALDYLLELNARFDGDWLLTMAAYNSGATTVNRAINRNRKAGRDTDFWSLSLPTETEDYIPKLIGLSQLVKRAQYEGIDLPIIPNIAVFDIVDIGSQIDLAQAAELAGISIEEMYRYNPGYNRWATDPNGPHRLAIPVTHSSQFSERLKNVAPDQRIHWSRYPVESGDNLIKIARRFNTDLATIKAANKLTSNTIRVGQVLLLPSASASKSQYALSADQRLASAQQRGEHNNQKSVYHKVAPGESLWVIARQYGVTVKALASWNNMVPKDPLHPGKKLIVWQNSDSRALSRTRTAPRNVIRRVGYTVRSGDSLAAIAHHFSVKVHDIVKWNAINTGKNLMPGQELSLYVDVTKLSGR
ncbi:MAG: membrane-bound lytic murein transglycosylase D [Paracoccaceae bacterium]|jgi:membrane-bound lytic murein transglycosylase D